MKDIPAQRQGAFELIEAFLPGVDVVYNEPADLEVHIEESNSRMTISAWKDQKPSFTQVYMTSKKEPVNSEEFKGFLYVFLKDYFKRELPWGSLTGIKPVKIAHKYIVSEHMSPEKAAAEMRRRYFVSGEKSRLSAALAENEIPYIYPLKRNCVSVYVGVPICPAKCAYCSFVSTVADKKGEIVQDYLDHLLDEIEAMNRLMDEKNLTVDTLYVGGGTPSIFSAGQIDTLLQALSRRFIHSGLREFTFEAGRPDTTTREKLEVLKQWGVDRICLNPQSMNDDTLSAIGRYHTAGDIERVYEMIRSIGFKTVNMDLIVGLNREPAEKCLSSIRRVINLRPENLTVHSLAIKKGSRIKEAQGHHFKQLYDEDFYHRVDEELTSAGYHPYYLYRQKYTQGNGENTGYSLSGHDGIYNMLMMAEKQTIIGIGAGSSGKIYYPDEDRFEKVFTIKDVRTYNARGKNVADKKIEAYEKIGTRDCLS